MLLIALLLAAARIPAMARPMSCDNEQLTAYDSLLVLAPHPDDEMLGFAGLVDAYRRQGKPVRVVVVTDGDAYCEACALWKNGALAGETCNALDLSNLATPEVDSFAEVRRDESRAAAALLRLSAPDFLAYPDTGLAAAWANFEAGNPDQALHRSDFSACQACGDCGGYGAGPALGLTAATLQASLHALIAGMPPGTLVASTHWLDGHGDHAALGRFTKALAASAQPPRAAAFAVIHAHTPKQANHPDCWYPAPGAAECPCTEAERALAEPRWWDAQARDRVLPDQPARLPDDVDYGEEQQLCLAPELLEPEPPLKQSIIAAYASQLGTLAREGELPAAVVGIMDCNGYLASFARSTEAFVLLTASDQHPRQ